MKKIGVSTATVTRIARAMSYGQGGYELVLTRFKAEAERVRALRKKIRDSHA